jgi:hypothetical protein
VTLSLAAGYTLPQSCSHGQTPKESNGSWTCATSAAADQSCASNKFANGIDGTGGVTCAATPLPKVSASFDDYRDAFPVKHLDAGQSQD